jgi:hypothetical protein
MPTESPSQTPTPVEPPDTLFVGPDGDPSNPGTEAAPLDSIDRALELADPGQTVRVLPGEYREGFSSRRPGTPAAPITITGPPDAVVRPPADDPWDWGCSLLHSHVHLTGLTFDGLAEAGREDDPDAYGVNAVVSRPPTWEASYPDYLTDVTIKPHAIGNTRRRHVNAFRVNHLEIGEFEVIGPAGLGYSLGAEDGYVIGAIISIGRSANNFGRADAGYPWTAPDESHGIHIHHVANLAGHDHTEFVKTHPGNYDVTVEYCTNAGGSGREDSPGAGSQVLLSAGRSTVRWNRFDDGGEHGVFVFTPRMQAEGTFEHFEPIPDDRFPGLNNAIYGNRLVGNDGRAML